MDKVLQRKIGNGSYGHVYKVNEKTACKKIKLKGKCIPPNAIKEVFFLSLLQKDDFVVQIKNFKVEKDNIYIFMELCDMSLYDYIINTNWKERRSFFPYFFHQIENMIKFLRFRNVVHYDIKPRNILLLGDKLKLCDFGLSHVIKDPQDNHLGCKFTARYKPPEYMKFKKNHEKFCTASDIWSFGITVLEFITGEKFIIDEEKFKNLPLLRNGRGIDVSKFLEKYNIPEKYISKLTSWLQLNPKNRFKYFDFDHQFISKFKIPDIDFGSHYKSIIEDKIYNSSINQWNFANKELGISSDKIILNEILYLNLLKSNLL